MFWAINKNSLFRIQVNHNLRFGNREYYFMSLYCRLFIFLPALYLYIFLFHATESFNECFCQTGVGH